MPDTSKTLHIQYFALLREQRGQNHETLISTAKTAEDLYTDLQKRYTFTLPLEMVKVSINRSFQPLQTVLSDEDHVVFIPPVAGG